MFVVMVMVVNEWSYRSIDKSQAAQRLMESSDKV